MPTTVVTVHELAGMLTDLTLTASTDVCFPPLCALQLFGARTERGVVLAGHSTDRYVLGQATLCARGQPLPPFLLSASDTRDLLAVLKTLPREEEVRISVAVHRLWITAPTHPRLDFTAVDGAFPDTAAYVRGEAGWEPGDAVRYDPARLAPFVRIAKRRRDRCCCGRTPGAGRPACSSAATTGAC